MEHVVAQFGRTGKPSIKGMAPARACYKRRIEFAVPSFRFIPPLLLGTERRDRDDALTASATFRSDDAAADR